MPLPTPPAKLGSLLPPDEFKAKARPAKNARKQGTVGEQTEVADYGTTSGVSAVAEPMSHAANTKAPLAAVAVSAVGAAEAAQAAPTARSGRKTKQTAALLQPQPASAPSAPSAAPVAPNAEFE